MSQTLMTQTQPVILPPVYAHHARQLCELLGALAVLTRVADKPLDDPEERRAYDAVLHLAALAHHDAGELAANLEALLPDGE